MIIHDSLLHASLQLKLSFTLLLTQLFYDLNINLVMTVRGNSGSEKQIKFRALSVTTGGEWSCMLNMPQKLADQGIRSGPRNGISKS